jgi:pyrimidine deaminase RibD-like protein
VSAGGVGDGRPRLVPGQPEADRHWLAAAVALSRLCVPSPSAFCVGAVVVSPVGYVIAAAYSRQADPHDHAEEAALGRAVSAGADLAGATVYSSLEPCLRRVSRPVSCAELIVRGGVRRVVYAWREPPTFQPGGGAAWLEDQGVAVIELPEFAPAPAGPADRPMR